MAGLRSLAAFCPIFREDNQHNACHGIETPVLKPRAQKMRSCVSHAGGFVSASSEITTAKDRLLRSGPMGPSY